MDQPPPFFSSPMPLPSLPLPSLLARDPLERGRRRAAGAWLPAPPAARAAPAAAGQMAGRAGHILQSDPEKATVRCFCFAVRSFSFRFGVSRASVGLWEREQPWCGKGGVRPSSERPRGGWCSPVLLWMDVGSRVPGERLDLALQL